MVDHLAVDKIQVVVSVLNQKKKINDYSDDWLRRRQ